MRSSSSRSESNSTNQGQSSNSNEVGQSNGQNAILTGDSQNVIKSQSKSKEKHQHSQENTDSEQRNEQKVNGALSNGETNHYDTEIDQQRECCTPNSTASSTDESSTNQQGPKCVDSCNDQDVTVLGKFFFFFF